MIVVTGATGQLGRLVVRNLIRRGIPSAKIVAIARSRDKAAELAELGVTIRCADYTRPQTLRAAFDGASRLLLISSSEVGKRASQHRAVIDAAEHAGVDLLAYTSLLHADESPLMLADEHVQTEVYLEQSGLPVTLLRNGWYTENYTGLIPRIIEHGALLGCAGQGRIASATREDLADAAAVVLTTRGHAGKTYELAGDEAYTLAEFVSELSRQTGRKLRYCDMAPCEYRAALLAAGLPEEIALLLADSEAGAAKGALFDDSHTLRHLIGRPTATLASAVAVAAKV